MLNHPYMDKIVVFLTIIAVIFSLLIAMVGFSGRINDDSEIPVPLYETKIFDKDNVVEVDITIDETDLQWLYENATLEAYRSADVTINGETFEMVGIRPKGNSSLRSASTNDGTDYRYSLKIEFDTYISGQNAYGLNKLVLNNMMSDATYMKEYLAYDLFERMGIATPLYSFAQININGENQGLYLMVESTEDSFLERQFGSTSGDLYKPQDSLVYKGESVSEYSGIFDYAETKITNEDQTKVIEMLKCLASTETDVNILKTALEKVLDVDEILRYIAVNTILVNLDSYAGPFHHNYLLYEEDGVFMILPWDLNMAFGGFETKSATSAINFSIDAPYSTDASEVPLISTLLEIPEYRDIYEAALEEAIAIYFDNGYFTEKIDQLNEKIARYVEIDSTAFYTYDRYQTSLPALKTFGILRAKSIHSQLADDFNEIIPEFDISALGSMNGGNKVMNGGLDAPLNGENAGTPPMPANVTMDQMAAERFNPLASLDLTLDDDTERQIMDIVMSVSKSEGTFSNAQIETLKSLGLSDDHINSIKSLVVTTPKGMNGIGAESNRPAADQSTDLQDGRAAIDYKDPMFLASVAFLLLGLAVVKRYNHS